MITPEEQALLDQKYEDLMEQVKEINPALYRRLRANELAGTVKDIQIVENDNQQMEMLL
tara:strand:+ start:430 stop:606 length:177 start_codon:yes stop_codon:yes gene_type:complete